MVTHRHLNASAIDSSFGQLRLTLRLLSKMRMQWITSGQARVVRYGHS